MMAHKVAIPERGVLHYVAYTNTTGLISSLLSLQLGIIKLKLVEISHIDFQHWFYGIYGKVHLERYVKQALLRFNLLENRIAGYRSE
jgi:hypothetical protein